MNRSAIQLLGTSIALGACLAAPGQAALVHRYSFSGSGSSVVDSVGSANGSLAGSATLSGGQVHLDGLNDSHVNLPAGLLPTSGSVSFEAWFNAPSGGAGSRVWDFGDHNNTSGRGLKYAYFSPHGSGGGAQFIVSNSDPGYNNDQGVSLAGTLDNGVAHYIAAVLDSSVPQMRLYIDGGAATTTPLTISLSGLSDQISYLGKSLYNGDALLSGTIDEFRIYNSALVLADVQKNFLLGPDNAVPEPAGCVLLLLAVFTLAARALWRRS